MRALTEHNLIVDINDRNGGTYIDIQKDGKTFCRKVMPYTLWWFS